MPSLANGDVTAPPTDTPGEWSSFEAVPLAAAAAAVALVVLRGVVSWSLPKGVAGGLGGDTLPEGPTNTSEYQASRACKSLGQALQSIFTQRPHASDDSHWRPQCVGMAPQHHGSHLQHICGFCCCAFQQCDKDGVDGHERFAFDGT